MSKLVKAAYCPTKYDTTNYKIPRDCWYSCSISTCFAIAVNK